mmetsp:Transcript_27655/g.86012  ORF Transcript_27655/g.86012 Transcript_27655/m.86012 type:complete len:309 (-) Transcript_27655:136-1062(-)
MPSQPRTMNSSSLVSSKVLTSGKAVTICSSGGRLSGRLYRRSPKARERFRSPCTLAPPGICCTKPPAFVMRAVSPGFSGLWSSESASTRPARDMIARESPALAQKICGPALPSRRTTRTTTAVQPWASGVGSLVSLEGSTRAISSSSQSSLSSPSPDWSAAESSAGCSSSVSASSAGGSSSTPASSSVSASSAFGSAVASAGLFSLSSWPSEVPASSASAASEASCCGAASPSAPSERLSSRLPAPPPSSCPWPGPPPRNRCRTLRGTTMGWMAAPASGRSRVSISLRPAASRSFSSTVRKAFSRALT